MQNMPLQIPQLLDHATLAEPGSQVVTATKSNDAAVNGLQDAGIRAAFCYDFFESAPEKTRFGDHTDRIRDYHRIADTYFGFEGCCTSASRSRDLQPAVAAHGQRVRRRPGTAGTYRQPHRM